MSLVSVAAISLMVGFVGGMLSMAHFPTRICRFCGLDRQGRFHA
jgi:hypothetical protein